MKLMWCDVGVVVVGCGLVMVMLGDVERECGVMLVLLMLSDV